MVNSHPVKLRHVIPPKRRSECPQLGLYIELLGPDQIPESAFEQWMYLQTLYQSNQEQQQIMQ